MVRAKAKVSQSVEAFVQERPLTYRAIQVICEKSRERQKEYGDRVRQDLIMRVTLGVLWSFIRTTHTNCCRWRA